MVVAVVGEGEGTAGHSCNCVVEEGKVGEIVGEVVVVVAVAGVGEGEGQSCNCVVGEGGGEVVVVGE